MVTHKQMKVQTCCRGDNNNEGIRRDIVEDASMNKIENIVEEEDISEADEEKR